MARDAPYGTCESGARHLKSVHHAPLVVRHSDGKEGEPVWPVAAELNEVFKVGETSGLELGYQLLERLMFKDRSDADNATFNAKFLIGEPESGIERRPREVRAFISVLSYENGRMTNRYT